MEPIFDRHGRNIGWLRGDYIFDKNSKYLGYIYYKTGVFSSKAKHIGYFFDGFFWDKKGYAVAFTRDAVGGPMKPAIYAPSAPSSPITPPIPPAPAVPVAAPARIYGWSEINWDDFFRDT